MGRSPTWIRQSHDPYRRPWIARITRAKIETALATPFCILAHKPSQTSESTRPRVSIPDRVKKLPFDGKHYEPSLPSCLKILTALGSVCLITIGGDDTRSFSPPFPLPGIARSSPFPRHGQNYVQGTEHCIGFSNGDHSRQRTHTTPSHTTLGCYTNASGDLPDFRPRCRPSTPALQTAYVTLHSLPPPQFPT